MFLNTWVHSLKSLITEEAKHDWSFWVKEAGEIGRKLILLPVRLDSVILKLERGEIRIQDPELSENVRKLEKSIAKGIGSILFAAFLLASVQPLVNEQEALSWIFRIAAAVILLWIIFIK